MQHNIPNGLQIENITKILPLLNEILENLTEGPNPNLSNLEIIQFADINKAVYALKANKTFSANSMELKCDDNFAIHKFLLDARTYLLNIINKLIAAQDDSILEDSSITIIQGLINCTNLLYSKSIDEKNELKKSDKLEDIIITMYKAKNGELCLRFGNKETCNEFLGKIGQGKIDSKFTKDSQGKLLPQFVKNESGKTPVKYNSNKECLYMPSYQAKNKEFAVNFGSVATKEAFIKLLGFKVTNGDGKGESKKDQWMREYENGFFKTFDSTLNYTGPKQDATIYFAPDNKIFTQPGSYLKVNVSKKMMVHGQLDLIDFSEPVEARPEGRRAVL